MTEIKMFRAFWDNNIPALLDLGRHFFKEAEFTAATHCFGYSYKNEILPPFNSMDLPTLEMALENFQMYVQSMSKVALDNPLQSRLSRQLFGLESRKDNRLFVPKNTFFYDSVTRYRTSRFNYLVDDGGVILTGVPFTTYREILHNYLRRLTQAQSNLCLVAPGLNPCLRFVAKGSCDWGSCRREHRARSMFDKTWYNLRIRVHLLQVNILHNLASDTEIGSLQRYINCG